MMPATIPLLAKRNRPRFARPGQLKVMRHPRLCGLFMEPIAQMQDFSYLSTLMSVSELFLWLEFSFSERVFRIPKDFAH